VVFVPAQAGFRPSLTQNVRHNPIRTNTLISDELILSTHIAENAGSELAFLRSHKGDSMHWYYLVSYFFGGAFIANSLPHLLNGMSGMPFQSPFAKPPGQGLSSPTVNVLWGFVNLVIGWILLVCVGSFSLHNAVHMLVVGAGFLIMGVLLARSFGRFHGGV
jgi:hypothetical protein